VEQVPSTGVVPTGVPPPGGGAVASAIARWWPRLDPTTLDGIAQYYQSWATQLDDSADTSDAVYRPRFGELLEGQAGDALQTSLGENANSWRGDAAQYGTASAAVSEAAAILRDLQLELSEIIIEYESAYEIADSERDPGAASQILMGAQNAAEAAATSAAARISSVLNGKFGTAPVTTNNGSPNAVLTSYETGTPQSAPGNFNGLNPHATSTTGPGEPAAEDGGYGQLSSGQVQTQPVTESSPVPTPVSSGASTPASSAPVSSGATTLASSGTVGSGSGFGSAPVSTAPAEGSAPAPGGGGSGWGVPPGLGSSGTLSPTMVPPQMLGSQAQPPTSGQAYARGKGDAATGGAASDLSPQPSPDVFSGSDGDGGAVSGGGMMPTPPAPAPMAPYSPPGAGLPSSTPPAPTPSAALGPVPAGPAAGGVPPIIAAGRAPTGAAAKRVNPDLVSAQRVLTGLVKACPARPIFWAVSVLRTPVGPQTLIAGSVGGGGYLPPEVSVPSTVRLAVLDPALPSGWAAAWMGWQSPLAILVDHYERVTKVVAGVTVSAMITSELWPRRPDCGGDFSTVRHEELVMSTAAPLVGGHRLTATDPALAARLAALDRGGDITNFVAAQLTRAVWTAAAQPDDTGLPIAVKEDADILGLVAEGAARPEHWDNYRRDVERRADGAVMMPEIHAPSDADDSPGSVTARMWYRHYYARGRIAEMVTCWASQPVSILDIAYCGVAAGLGAVIAAVVAELEKRLAESAGLAGGTR
jgi:hypothetical protein